jgi:two-component system chemotaxis response regulator CheB
MKQNLTSLSQRYVTALRAHLKPGSRASLLPALALGRQAVARGVETLELARIHEQALTTLELSKSKNGAIKQAEIFITEALTPIVETHRAAQQSKVHVNRLKETLGRRTEELAATNRLLQRGVVRRKVMANAAEKSGRRHDQCLKESLQLQERLRQLTHRVLAAQEDERHKISHELQDEIASTQRLVINSARSVRRFERELDLHQPAQSFPSVAALPNAVAPSSRRQRVSVNRIVKKKSSPAEQPDKSANAACETTPVARASRSFPVIAMAASVGGLKALSVILGGLPGDFPAAIAIVMHLAPDHKSLLAEILNRRTHLVVKEAHTGDILCPACAFIAPPNHHLLVAKDGRLELSSAAAQKIHFARPSAEPLFASVARVYKNHAIAVVLTGGDGDGSFGVQIIKERGGQVIAQDRPTSQDFSMPETSIKTGDVDFILPLNAIAPKLIELVWAGEELESGRTPAKKPKADL